MATTASGSSATSSAAAADATGGIRAVTRAIRLLGAFRDDDLVLSIADLVRRTGLPRTTVLRLAETLQADGMLETDRDGRMRPGAGLMAWAALANDAWHVPDVAREHMQAIAEEVGETVSLYVRSSLHRRVIAQAQPREHRLRHVVEVGDRLPLWGGASAIALLAQEPDARAAELVDAVVALGDAPLGADAILERVRTARDAGFAASHGVRELGISGVAVPLAREDGSPLPIVAALAAGGPTARFDDAGIARLRAALDRGAVLVREAGLPIALR